MMDIGMRRAIACDLARIEADTRSLEMRILDQMVQTIDANKRMLSYAVILLADDQTNPGVVKEWQDYIDKSNDDPAAFALLDSAVRLCRQRRVMPPDAVTCWALDVRAGIRREPRRRRGKPATEIRRNAVIVEAIEQLHDHAGLSYESACEAVQKHLENNGLHLERDTVYANIWKKRPRQTRMEC